MKSSAALPVVSLLAACGNGHVDAHFERHVDWGYEHDGPDEWGSLCEEYSTCSDGKRQSPIDIVTSGLVRDTPLTIGYAPVSLAVSHHEHVVDVSDNGHTIQVRATDAGSMEVDGVTYEVIQFHFHAPSEHTVDGRRFPLEMHVVHQSQDGAFAVLGVLFEEGDEHPFFRGLTSSLPNTVGETVHKEHVTVHLDDLLPKSSHLYGYSGSLTTPPCWEDVHWAVAIEPVALSRQQIEAFESRIAPNNRPVQPLNGRKLSLSGKLTLAEAGEPEEAR